MTSDPTDGATILVVDDDPDIARYVELNLTLEGFEVKVEHYGAAALATAYEMQPDIVLLDVMMPGIDGYEVCRQLRAHPRTAHCSVIMVTAKTMSADAILGLTSGADDYIAKPFDPTELVARVRATLRRAKDLRDISPLTGLPGNGAIRRLLDVLVARPEQRFALVYADLDRFKSFNDRYGFGRGDQAIVTTAKLLEGARLAFPGDPSFLGHIGGDDFAALVPPEAGEAYCQRVVARWDAVVPQLYDPEDVAAGGVEVTDRRGVRERFGFMTISLGVATTERRQFASAAEVVSVASEMKVAAKALEGSSYLVDRRTTT